MLGNATFSLIARFDGIGLAPNRFHQAAFGHGMLALPWANIPIEAEWRKPSGELLVNGSPEGLRPTAFIKQHAVMGCWRCNGRTFL
jgi:hypothetical protein